MGKRMKRKLADLRRKLKRRMHADPIETGAWLGQVLNGWLNYYAEPTSSRSLSKFRYALQQNWMWVLSRRSQRARPDWEKLDVLCKHPWPKVTIRHEWPDWSSPKWTGMTVVELQNASVCSWFER